MQVRWLTVFVDRPDATFDAARDFWLAATGTTASPSRGARAEFATLVPAVGDAYVRVQRIIDGPGGSHLDVHVDDVRTAADEAVGLGAVEVDDQGGVIVLRSPGGLVFCLVAHHGEAIRPAPVTIDASGCRSRLDQVCVDVAPDRFEDDIEFFVALTGWSRRTRMRSEFDALDRPPDIPLRLLFQRRGEPDAGRPTSCHIDLACDDIDATVAHHVGLGATVVARRLWTVMADPAGVEYCITPRDPDTGLLPG